MQSLTPKEIIAALKEHGITQYDIKDRIGTSQSVINRIATGKNLDPRVSLVKSLEKLYEEIVIPPLIDKRKKTKLFTKPHTQH